MNHSNSGAAAKSTGCVDRRFASGGYNSAVCCIGPNGERTKVPDLTRDRQCVNDRSTA